MNELQVADFRKICARYRPMAENIRSLRERETELRLRMNGVHAVRCSGYSHSRTGSDTRVLRYMEKIDELRTETAKYENRLHLIDRLFAGCSNEAARIIVWRACVQRIPVRRLAELYDISERTAEKQIRSGILSILHAAEPAVLAEAAEWCRS